MKETALSWADFVAKHLPEELGKKLRALIEAVPKQNTLLHGDYHTNNLMVQNGEPLLIDRDTLCMGHPVFELGSMFNAFVGFSEINSVNSNTFLGYSLETAQKFWDMALKPILVQKMKRRAMVWQKRQWLLVIPVCFVVSFAVRKKLRALQELHIVRQD